MNWPGPNPSARRPSETSASPSRATVSAKAPGRVRPSTSASISARCAATSAVVSSCCMTLSPGVAGQYLRSRFSAAERAVEVVRRALVAQRLVEPVRGLAFGADAAGQLDDVAARLAGQFLGAGHEAAAGAAPASRLADDEGRDAGGGRRVVQLRRDGQHRQTDDAAIRLGQQHASIVLPQSVRRLGGGRRVAQLAQEPGDVRGVRRRRVADRHRAVTVSPNGRRRKTSSLTRNPAKISSTPSSSPRANAHVTPNRSSPLVTLGTKPPSAIRTVAGTRELSRPAASARTASGSDATRLTTTASAR